MLAKTTENRNWMYPVVRYFTWKLEFFSNILPLVIVLTSPMSSSSKNTEKRQVLSVYPLLVPCFEKFLNLQSNGGGTLPAGD